MGPNSFTLDFRSLPFLLNRTEGLDSAAFGFDQHATDGVKRLDANLVAHTLAGEHRKCDMTLCNGWICPCFHPFPSKVPLLGSTLQRIQKDSACF